MFIPYFNIKENYHLFNQQRKEANGYCLNCNRPIPGKFVYCGACNTRKLMIDGLEGTRVRIGMVGRDTINYQQYLHRSIFKCNVHIDYRGNKQDRVKARVSDEAMKVATTRLHRVLSCNKYTYNEKEYLNNQHNRNNYISIQDTRNIDKRLIYNILLYYISYHINNNHDFKTEIHFQTSMMQNLLINIETTYIRLNQEVDTFNFQHMRKTNRNTYWYWLYEEINSIIQPLMSELILNIHVK